MHNSFKKLWRTVRHYFNDILTAAGASDASDEIGNTPGGENPGESVNPATQATDANHGCSDASATTAPAVKLLFKYGGVKADPTEDERCRISNLKMTGSGLSMHWDTGIPADWKKSADTGKGELVLACAFYWDAAQGAYIGGKFDWTNAARSTRSFENIKSGYHGWDWTRFDSAARRAFCVVSADGKRRSNLLET